MAAGSPGGVAGLSRNRAGVGSGPPPGRVMDKSEPAAYILRGRADDRPSSVPSARRAPGSGC